jgi:anthranilate phosphoribosyltransferase
VSESVRTALAAVVEGRVLSRDEARAAMGAIMDGEATPAQLAALLVALRMRGETIEELAGFTEAMRARVTHVDAPPGTIDTCGTGGDARGTFNISTTAALVVAAAGVPVAKHGNRAITSASGSSDVLGALGVLVEQSAEEAADSLREDGFAFLFAPGFHPAMRHAGPTRREIGVRTAFNLLGPLTNPAGARRQLVGVGDPSAAAKLAAVLGAIGVERAFVVHGDRLDELPLDGSGVLYDISVDGVRQRTITPREAGLPRASTDQLTGGSPPENAAITESVLGGAGGPRRDVVVLNAGAALQVAGRVEALREGIELAAATIDSGSASALLERLRARRRRIEAARAAAAQAEATDDIAKPQAAAPA